MSDEDLFTKVSIGGGLKDGERIYQYEGYAGFLSPHRLKGSIERRGNKVFVYDERGVVKETIEFSGNRINHYEGCASFLIPHRFKGSLERRGDRIFEYDDRGVIKGTTLLSGVENPVIATFKAVDGFGMSIVNALNALVASPDRDERRYVPIQIQQTTTTSSSSGCFVATAVYSDPEAPQVQALRDFRDNVLMEHPLGKRFVDFYYSGAGKRTADFIKEHLPSAIPLIRRGLDALVERYSAQRR